MDWELSDVHFTIQLLLDKMFLTIVITFCGILYRRQGYHMTKNSITGKKTFLQVRMMIEGGYC